MSRGSPLEVLCVFLRLGLTSFGGPIAHLGYFRSECVERRRWLEEGTYADLVALCQFLPGPASSQVAFALGVGRAGAWGGAAAWTGFTLPSVIVMLLFARGADALGGPWGTGVLHGLKLVAVAIVAQAVWGMARTLCPDRQRAVLAAVGAATVLVGTGALNQVGAIVLGGVGGVLFCREPESPQSSASFPAVSRRVGAWALVAFTTLLAFLPLAAWLVPSPALSLFEAFYRAGALVFGGGHVVLPLLHGTVVAPGWVTENAFLSGYGAAQAVPGPLFSFAAYLGAVATPMPGIVGGLVGLFALYLPGVLVLVGALPFWGAFRQKKWAQGTMRGVNAAVVGLLGAALYDPLWRTSVHGRADFGVALGCFVLLTAWRAPPLWVVLAGGLAGLGLALATA